MTLPRDPIVGETLRVESIGLTLGGKAVNQGLQTAQLDDPVLIVGEVGEDILGAWALEQLLKRGFDMRGILQEGMTSCAVPVILPASQYILHVPGANQLLTPEDIQRTQHLWTTAKILLIQGEVPTVTSIQAAQIAKSRGMLIICEPAPATAMTRDLLQLADILTPNRQELSMLSNQPAHSVEEQAWIVWEMYPQLTASIVTLGDEGVLLHTQDRQTASIAAPVVTALDPTAAGDAFNGTLAYLLAKGLSLRHSTELGCCADALAASRKGSSASLASLSDIVKIWSEVYQTNP